jgi:outer membrane lipoprotein-sorting protein
MLRYRTVAALTGGLAFLALCPHSARADEKGEALLREVAQATRKTLSLTADITTTTNRTGEREKRMTGKFAVQRPNLAKIDMTGQPLNQMVVSNGKEMTIVIKDQKQYKKQKATANGESIYGAFFLGSLFFTPDIKTHLGSVFSSFGAGKSTISPTLKEEEVRDGVKYQVLEIADNGARKMRLRVYVGPQKLIQGVILEQTFNEKALKVEEFFSNMKVGAKLSVNLFAYKPPAGYKLHSPSDNKAKLLAVGTEAPAFELTRPEDKSKVSLARMLEGRKAVLVNFWFYY